jgi:hypothetical protein
MAGTGIRIVPPTAVSVGWSHNKDMIYQENIIIGAIGPDNTCRSWLEGLLFQSVGSNPITINVAGKSSEEIMLQIQDCLSNRSEDIT